MLIPLVVWAVVMIHYPEVFHKEPKKAPKIEKVKKC